MQPKIRATVQCRACGAVYERPGHNEEPYFHVCAPIEVDGVLTQRPGHRNENPRVSEEAGHASIVAEGDGVEVLHQGPRTPEELGMPAVKPTPKIRAKHTRKKTHGVPDRHRTTRPKPR